MMEQRKQLLGLVEEHITSLIRQAASVTAHCKRARATVPDDDDDGAVGGGIDRNSRVVRRRLHAEDLNMALQWRGSEKLYATGLTSDTATISVGTSGNPAQQQQQLQCNKVVDLKEYLRSEMDFRPPQEVGLTVHWLAVNGQQPFIPQNPMGQPSRGRAVAGLLRKYDGTEDDDDAIASSFASVPSADDTTGVAKKGSVQVSQLRAQLLSEELQLYFVRITTTLERGGATPTARQQQDAALASVGRDTGLQELVPFLVHYILNSYEAHVGNPEQSHTLVRLVQSLLTNPHLHLELHLQHLLPVLLTFIVAKNLSSRPWENHWALRTEAALTLVRACRRFGDKYANLTPRVLHELCVATGIDQPLATRFGGFVAISLFGPRAIASFLLPLAIEHWTVWQETLDTTTNLTQRFDLQMCQQAILISLGEFLGQGDLASQASEAVKLKWEDLEETFGDRVVLLSNESTDYSLCAI